MLLEETVRLREKREELLKYFRGLLEDEKELLEVEGGGTRAPGEFRMDPIGCRRAPGGCAGGVCNPVAKHQSCPSIIQGDWALLMYTGEKGFNSLIGAG